MPLTGLAKVGLSPNGTILNGAMITGQPLICLLGVHAVAIRAFLEITLCCSIYLIKLKCSSFITRLMLH